MTAGLVAAGGTMDGIVTDGIEGAGGIVGTVIIGKTAAGVVGSVVGGLVVVGIKTGAVVVGIII